MEDKKSKEWVVNLEDPAVRSICVAINGEALSPYQPPPAPPAGTVVHTLSLHAELLCRNSRLNLVLVLVLAPSIRDRSSGSGNKNRPRPTQNPRGSPAGIPAIGPVHHSRH